MSEFTLEFELSAEEVQEAQRIYCRSAFRRKKSWNLRGFWSGFGRPFALVVVTGLLALRFVENGTLVWEPKLAGAAFFAGVLITMAIWAALTPRGTQLDNPSAAAGILATIEHYYDHKGVSLKSSEFKGFQSWKVFSELVDLNKYFCLSFGSGTYYIIPKSAFSSEEEAGRWREFCEKHIAAAHA